MAWRPIISAVLSLLILSGQTLDAWARDRLMITGSSTVSPFLRLVSEKIAPRTAKPSWIEETGTGGGLHLFCAGKGDATPDIAGASRRISTAELAQCRKNGIIPVEVSIGYDGLIFAHAKENRPLHLTREWLFMALAEQIPTADGGRINNPYRLWSDISPQLPTKKIEIIGPSKTSGTRDALHTLVMMEGCKAMRQRLQLEAGNAPASSCHRIRLDGAYVEAGENDSLVVKKLMANPNAIGVFGFSYLLNNSAHVQGASIDGTPPIAEAIFDGRYSLNRYLYVYAKKEHIALTPALQDFLTELTSEPALSSQGYLAKAGLVALSKSERDHSARLARALIGLESVP